MAKVIIGLIAGACFVGMANLILELHDATVACLENNPAYICLQ